MNEEGFLHEERSCSPQIAKKRTDGASQDLQEGGGEEEIVPGRTKPRSGQHCISSPWMIITIITILLVSTIFLIVRFVHRSPVKEALQQCSNVKVNNTDGPAPCGPACSPGWIGYEGKCYFFSDGAKNWTASKSFCTSHDSSLAVIENEPEKVFIAHYQCHIDHWIGLWKKPNQTWKWEDGTELNSALVVRGEGGTCAFLSSGSVSSSRCHIERNWICSHHDIYTRNKSPSVRS